MVNFPFLDGDVPRAKSYGIHISQLICFYRARSSVEDLNSPNLILTEKLLKQIFRFHKLRHTFSKFYYGNLQLISKYVSNLKALPRQEFYTRSFMVMSFTNLDTIMDIHIF